MCGQERGTILAAAWPEMGFRPSPGGYRGSPRSSPGLAVIRLFAPPVALSTLHASIERSCLPETCRGYAWISPFSPGRGCVSIYGGADGLSVFSLSSSFSSFLSHWNFRGLSFKNGQQMKPYIPAPTHLILRTAGPPQAKVMEGGTVCLDSPPAPKIVRCHL